MAIDKQNNRHTIPPQTHITFTVPRFKGIGSFHKSGTGNNQGRQRTTPQDNRWFNCNYCHSNSNEMSLPLISFSPPFNNSVINPSQLSSVRQQHSALHISLLVITGALIARTVSQREMNCHHRWYLCLLHWMIPLIIQLSCPRFVSSRPDLRRTQRMSFKLLQYPVGLHLIRKITFHHRPPRM